jgi:hypothetical protein
LTIVDVAFIALVVLAVLAAIATSGVGAAKRKADLGEQADRKVMDAQFHRPPNEHDLL